MIKITQEVSSSCRNYKTCLNRSKLVTGATLRAPQSVCTFRSDPPLYLPGHNTCRSVATDRMKRKQRLVNAAYSV